MESENHRGLTKDMYEGRSSFFNNRMIKFLSSRRDIGRLSWGRRMILVGEYGILHRFSDIPSSAPHRCLTVCMHAAMACRENGWLHSMLGA